MSRLLLCCAVGLGMGSLVYGDCLPAEIIRIGSVGGQGVTISGSAGCLYWVYATNREGETIYEVRLPNDATTVQLDIEIAPDTSYLVTFAGEQNPSGGYQVGPSFLEWAFILMVLKLLGFYIFRLVRYKPSWRPLLEA